MRALAEEKERALAKRREALLASMDVGHEEEEYYYEEDHGDGDIDSSPPLGGDRDEPSDRR